MKRMKRRILAVGLLAALGVLAGCQATPEAEVVKAKNGQALIEKASAETGGTLAERVDAPARYKGEASNAEGTLKVTIDGTVTVPEAEKVPIYRVTPGAITQEQADTLMAELVHAPLYEVRREQTKEEIMEELMELKQKLAEGPTETEDSAVYLAVGEDGETETITWEESIQTSIDSLTERYESAPETIEDKPVTGQLVPQGEGYEGFSGRGSSEESGYESLSVHNNQWILGDSMAQYRRMESADGDRYGWDYMDAASIGRFYPQADTHHLPDIAVTEEEAAAMGTALADKLGVPGLMLWSVDKEYNMGAYLFGDGVPPISCAWALRFVRSVDGVPITYTSDTPVVKLTDDGTFEPPWQYETLTIYIDDGGIVGLDWMSLYDIGEVLAEDSALLPFSEIMDIFEKMYVVANDDQTMDTVVDSIRLGYARIQRQDVKGEAMLVPVWDFFGTRTDLEGDEPRVFGDKDQSLLTINAVDGTIVDRSLGY